MADIIGSNSVNDSISGTSKADVIYTGDGNDVVLGGGGDDLLFGGEGKNNLAGGEGEDVVVAGSGGDTLSGGQGNDIVLGGAGKDTITGSEGDDILSGGAGGDVFQFKVGFGNDIITDLNFAEGDYINLYSGVAGAKNVTLRSEADLDKLIAAGGATTASQTDGSLLVTLFNNGVETGSLKLVGWGDVAPTKGVGGSSGEDLLIGGAKVNQAINGGSGDDILVAGGDGAQMMGGGGNDKLIGGAGNDTLSGGEGDDLLFGGVGNDLLNGSEGNDILTGGDGKDIFQFKGSGFGHDTVTDLNFSDGDSLVFAIDGGNTKITSLQGLYDYAASHSGVGITSDAVSLTISWTGVEQSVRLIGVEPLSTPV
jgi:Ca2+-binding RTX toxin-like protein